MKHHVIGDIPAATQVLTIQARDVAPFVQKCVRERSLSVLVKQLNYDIAFGTPEQKQEAQQALRHIGFI